MENSNNFNLELNDEVFSLFSDMVYKTAGIKIGHQKKSLLTSRLAKRLKITGADSFPSYYKIVKTSEDELIEMLNCISTHTTNFFRENHHFEYLKNRIIPELLKNRASEKAIRLWSAGCSTGEEPYSIAISIHQAFLNNGIKPEKWDIKILATDISTSVLETAQNGIYEFGEIPQDMPPDIIARYFLKGARENANKIKVKDFLKRMIVFRRLNFKDASYPFNRRFDVIFCRNVMIYFDAAMKKHIMTRFYNHLSEDGYLIFGHAETMLNSDMFSPVHITVYKKK